ncbi:hypothetical protein HJC23_009877 [Cyclotella cryptica]|uniref:Oxidation resistance protein 1 n=1 Tax=Cyclotella cryptica TaxID=29204 RepID=A0ABD3QAU2_9STRA|eukprot:CCRYP_006992-RA/>CCRYP_006992-RA protein AED:0.03 eAED:0.03 QI:0/-1/0/1/-1/1/1/0/660
MGNSASSTKEATQLIKERTFIRSLGDRYPLGDSELRKWVWCHQRLVEHSSPPNFPSDGSLLLSLAVWSVIYGDYNPYVKGRPESSSFYDNVSNARKLTEAMKIVEQHILPHELGARLIRQALSVSDTESTLRDKSHTNTPFNFPNPSMPREEVITWQNNNYSIRSSTNEVNNYAREDFLEVISVSCGRRGSRAALKKMFMLCCIEGGGKVANASDVIYMAYCLTVAASYLKNVATNLNNQSTVQELDWRCFVPQKNEKDMKAMVDSLINSAKRQRKDGRGGFTCNFDYSYSSSTASKSSGADDTVSLDEFLEWAETAVPMISSALPTFLHVLLSYFSPINALENRDEQQHRFPPGVTPIWIPSLTVETKDSTSIPASSTLVDPSTSLFDLFALSCTSLSLASGRWHRLFSSEANGLSCNRLMHSLLGYGGPTLILIRSKGDGGTFGAYTFTPWNQESGTFYGNSDCFLFRLGPDPFSVYRPKGSGSGISNSIDDNRPKAASNNENSETRNFQYFNPEARSKGYDGLSHGIGFGGTPELPRLFIDEVLDGCCAKAEDLTYDNGPLVSGNSTSNGNFEVEAIEAWGVGSPQLIEEALLARDGQREDAAKRIRRAMKGAKGQFLEDFQSGLAGSKLFQHRNEISGRDGGCDLDEAEGDGRASN